MSCRARADMLFDIESDDGLRVSGWVAPDHPGAEAAVIVSTDDGGRYRVPATRLLPAFRDEGRHATGICGFVVEPSSCPGLRAGIGLALLEERSNTLLYRRPRPGQIPARLFHLEGDSDDRLFGPALDRLFQLRFGSVGFIGEETLVSILGIGFSDSILVSGSLLMRRVEPYLRSAEFVRSVRLAEPVAALAGTLLQIDRVGQETGPDGLGWRSLGRSGLIRAFSGADLTDPPALERAILALDDEDAMALADPLTRKLAAKTAQEFLTQDHVARAIETLAAFDVVGFRHGDEGFAARLGSALGTGPLPLDPAAETGRFWSVVDALAACEPARELVAFDDQVVSTARRAFGEVAGRETFA